jgi:hypothetical protein
LAKDARSTKRNGARQLVLDLQPDPAGLRDRAARLRDDAEAMSDGAMKAGLIAAASDAEHRAESAEISALWTTPMR